MKLKVLFVALFCAIVSLNAQDKAKWAKFLGGDIAVSPALSHTGRAAINNLVLKDGYLFVNGYYAINGCWNGVALPEDIGVNGMISKLDLDGNVQWTSTITGVGYPNSFTDIAVDSKGDVIGVGWLSYFEGETCFINGEIAIPGSEEEMWGIAFNKAFVAKLSGEDGSLKWLEYWEMDNEVAPTRITIDPDDNIYVLGRTLGAWGTVESISIGGYDHALTNHYSQDLFYFKMDSEGKCEWVKTVDGDDGEYGTGASRMQPRSIVYGNDKLYIGVDYSGPMVVNETTLPTPQNAYMTAILAADAVDGTIIDFIAIGDIKGDQSIARLKIDQEGNVIVAGHFYSVDGFKIGDTTLSLTGGKEGLDDAFVAKFDSDLNSIWAKNMGGDYIDRAFNLTVTDDNTISVGGGFDPASPFSYDGDALTIPAATGLSMFQLLIDEDGEFLDLHTIIVQEGFSELSNSETVIHPSGRMFSVGNWVGEVNLLDPMGESMKEDHTKGFVMEWDRGVIVTDIAPISVENATVAVGPNPFADQLNVMISQSHSAAVKIQINSLDGRTVYSTTLNNSGIIDLSFLNKGIYLLNVAGDRINTTKKIVKK